MAEILVLLGIKEAYDKLTMYNRRQAAMVSISRLPKLCDNCWCCYKGKCCGVPLRRVFRCAVTDFTDTINPFLKQTDV
jgi:hypothetical protein